MREQQGKAMTSANDIKRYSMNFKEEMGAADLYRRMAATEKNPSLASVYLKLADTEEKHADFWRNKLIDAGADIPKYKPDLRTRVFGWLSSKMGASTVMPAVASIERSAASQYDGQPEASGTSLPADERSHARIFSILAMDTSGIQGSDLARVEGRHRASGGNALRAAVLGANDGLVSVFCLVMGVAGAGMPSSHILLTGLAGLLAGALSMALGEWLSVQSSRELYQNQMNIEKMELTENPQEEKEELALIYQAKGLDPDTANKLAERLISDPATALDTLAREELGIDPNELGGSAWEAAFTSFLLFTAGALFPVVPYIFLTGTEGIVASAVVSSLALFAIGAAITMMTGRNPIYSGLRQMMFGLITAAVTFGIGHLIGVNIAG